MAFTIRAPMAKRPVVTSVARRHLAAWDCLRRNSSRCDLLQSEDEEIGTQRSEKEKYPMAKLHLVQDNRSF